MNARKKPASAKAETAPDIESLDERSRRAWTESMAVRPLRDGRYAIEGTTGATYVVDLRQSDCSCPDNEIRGELCKHIRRVAIEINHGTIPAPDRSTKCRVCGREIAYETEQEPALCDDCRLEPGDLVYDRERDPDTPLLVIAVTDRRADEVEIEALGCTVAEYAENRKYNSSDPVVEVIYPRSVRVGRTPHQYSFPISRLAKSDDGSTQSTLLTSST